MKIVLPIIITLFTVSSKAQVSERIDSLSGEICKSYEKLSGPLDSVSVIEIFYKHTNKFLSKMDEDVRDLAIQKLSVRLETQCQKYSDFTRKSANQYWTHVSGCPKITISEADAGSFFERKNFWYIQSLGDTTKALITDKEWVDHMNDGTYSKLSLKRTSPYDFNIRFIQSNNKYKSSMSKRGDLYLYSIISKSANYYTICVSLPGINRSSLFKLYFQPE